MLEILIK